MPSELTMLPAFLQRRAGLQSAGDYTSYRKYATTRLKELRKRANLTVKPGKKLQRENLVPGQWELAVLDAERHWANAMAKRAALEANAESKSSLKHQISSKLAKAVKYSNSVVELENNSDISASLKLEFAVYAALVAGESAIELQQWPKVSQNLAKVRVGISALQAVNSEKLDVLDDLVSGTVDPAFRLSLAQQSQDSTVDLSYAARQIVEQNHPEFAKQVRSVYPGIFDTKPPSQTVSDVTFRQHVAKVKYGNLAHLLQKTQASQGHDLEESISLWQQCEYEVSNLIAEINGAGEQREQDLDIINTYVQFNLLSHRIQRDASEAYAEYEKSSDNAIRMYEVVLQSCNTMAELPGVFNDDELVAGIDGMTLYYQTFRTLALAKTHPVGSKESLALVNLAYQRLVQQQEQDSQLVAADVELPVSSQQLEELKSMVKVELTKSYSRCLLYTELENRSKVMGSMASDIAFRQPNPALVADLDVKKIEPVAVKPVFYDMAYNHVHPEDNDEEMGSVSKELRNTEETVPEKKEQKKKLFGLF